MLAPRRITGLAAAAVVGLTLALAGCGGGEPGGQDGGGDVDRRTPSPVESGTTTLEIGRTVAGMLSTAGIRVMPTGDARQTLDGIEIPVSGGELGVEPLAGRLRHAGGLRLSAGDRSVDAQALALDLGSGELSAEVAGTRMTLLEADLAASDVNGDATEATIPRGPVALTGEAVAPLNEALGVDLLSEGLRVGELGVKARWR